MRCMSTYYQLMIMIVSVNMKSLQEIIMHVFCFFCVLVKAPQQQSLPPFSSFYQETPMKPSQVPNLLSHPAHRRVLPLQTSYLHYKDRSDSPQHHTHVPGPLYSPGLVPGSQTNISPSVSRCVSSSPANMGSLIFKPQPTAKDRPGPPQQPGQPRPGTLSTSTFSPVSPTYSNTSANKLQPSTPSIVLSDHAPCFPINTDQKAVSRVTAANPGSKNETAHRQASHKVLFSLLSTRYTSCCSSHVMLNVSYIYSVKLSPLMGAIMCPLSSCTGFPSA